VTPNGMIITDEAIGRDVEGNGTSLGYSCSDRRKPRSRSAMITDHHTGFEPGTSRMRVWSAIHITMTFSNLHVLELSAEY
jgi:hypothetical protein